MGRTPVLGFRKALGKTFTLGEALAWVGVLLLIIVLGAHFFRAGNHLMAVCLAGLFFFHGSGSSWKTFVVGFVLAWGVMEWGAATRDLAVLRAHMGAPWMRGALILCLVASMTALGAVYTLRKAIRQKKESPGEPVVLQTVAFLLIFAALYALRATKPDVLLLERFSPRFGGMQIFLLAWYGGYIVDKLHNYRTSRKARKTIWLIFTLVFFGQLGLGVFGIPGVALSDALHIPIPAFIFFAPAYRGSFSMMPFLLIGATLLAGSAWCSLLCYFGSIEANLPSAKIIKKAPPWLETAIRYGRPAILVAGCGTALALRYFGVTTEASLSLAAVFAALSFAIMLFVSKKYTGMVHCTAFCPIGWVVNLMGKLSPWRITVDKRMCDGCGACEKVCSYRAIHAENRERGGAGFSCSLCRDCIGVCPHNAIAVKNFLLPSRLSNGVFTVIVVVLHVLFLTAARPM